MFNWYLGTVMMNSMACEL